MVANLEYEEGRLLDHPVRSAKQSDWESEAERLAVLRLRSNYFADCRTGRSPGLAPLRKRFRRGRTSESVEGKKKSPDPDSPMLRYRAADGLHRAPSARTIRAEPRRARSRRVLGRGVAIAFTQQEPRECGPSATSARYG
jgi:hypothetical protein